MQFVSEKEIDAVLEQLEQGVINLEEIFEDFKEDQNAFVQFIATENFKLLKDEEYELFTFIIMVIYQSCLRANKLPSINPEEIQKIDESNWSVYNDTSNKEFSKMLDLFFDQYPQEDLLAFVEDSVVDTEELKISQIGREIIFISTKTLIDCLNIS